MQAAAHNWRLISAPTGCVSTTGSINATTHIVTLIKCPRNWRYVRRHTAAALVLRLQVVVLAAAAAVVGLIVTVVVVVSYYNY